MAFVKIMVHAVWRTKEGYPFLTKDIRSAVIEHIKENAKKISFFIDRLNGYTDHLHCLLELNADMSISKTMQLIKGESSFWMNRQKITTSKFEWADEYYAVSVSESLLKKVRAYINRQEEHHRKIPFSKELEELIISHGLKKSG